MKQPLDYLHETPSQTAGPYVHIGCTPNFSGIEGVFAEDPGSRMVNDETLGERITIRGSVYDGTGTVVQSRGDSSAGAKKFDIRSSFGEWELFFRYFIVVQIHIQLP